MDAFSVHMNQVFYLIVIIDKRYVYLVVLIVIKEKRKTNIYIYQSYQVMLTAKKNLNGDEYHGIKP